MESENLEKLLESVFEVESEDIFVSNDAPLPCKLRWIVSDGSYVTKDQILAILTPYSDKDDSETEGKDKDDLSLKKDTIYESLENICDVANMKLIVKSSKNGKLVRNMENLSELTSFEQVLGKIEFYECTHEVVVHGLCANCSSSVEVSSFKRKHEDVILKKDDKVVPGFITNHSGVELDPDLAHEMECTEISKYLEDRKLCLVLDLDNTLVHATSQKAPVDIDIETIDVSSPEWENTLKYVQYGPEDDAECMSIQHRLESCIIKTVVYNESETSCCNSYFKLRPGIFNFFRKLAGNYKFFLFTMGTRQHAISALQILDPQGLYFGNRIFCRNDSRSSMKSLDRIFPKHKNLVLVLDDSEYVWTNHMGLIKVHPYYFFSDITYLNNYDLNNLMRSSAALQSICNYSNFIWSKLIHTSNTNTGGLHEELHQRKEETPNKIDKDGFAIPDSLKKFQFRYNGYLICNERPSNIYSRNRNPKCCASKDKGELFKKIYIKDNDMQLFKMVKLLNDIYDQFYEQYDMVLKYLNTDSDDSDAGEVCRELSKSKGFGVNEDGEDSNSWLDFLNMSKAIKNKDNDLENDGNHVDGTYDNNDDNESDINDKDDEILNEEKELDQEGEDDPNNTNSNKDLCDLNESNTGSNNDVEGETSSNHLTSKDSENVNNKKDFKNKIDKNHKKDVKDSSKDPSLDDSTDSENVSDNSKESSKDSNSTTSSKDYEESEDSNDDSSVSSKYGLNFHLSETNKSKFEYKVDTKYMLDNNLLPKASIILNRLRERILKDVTLYSNTCEFINLNAHNNRFNSDSEDDREKEINFLLCSDFGKWALKFGATITNQLDKMTHVIVNNRNSIILNDNKVKKVHIKWLEAVLYSYEYVDEEKFNPDLWRVPYRSFWDVLST